MEPYVSGTLAGTGSFRCDTCGYVLTLAAADRLSDCPGCGGDSFSRASLFSAPTSEAAPAFTEADRDDWLDEARSNIDEPGEYLAFEDGDEIVVGRHRLHFLVVTEVAAEADERTVATS